MLHSTIASAKTKSRSLKRFGVIDLGTNSLRFDAYEIQGKSLRRFHREKRMIRLGDGVFRNGKISPKAVARGLRAFDIIHTLLKKLEVPYVVAFGTSALRSAMNARQFVETVKKRTGIPIRIISGLEEGALIAQGIIANTKMPKGPTVLVDIGGGSTEVTVCTETRIIERHSFRLGANRLQQMFFKTIPPVAAKRGELHPVLALRQHIRETLHPLTSKNVTVKFSIGSSGTIRTLHRILKKIDKTTDGIDRTELAALVAEMTVMTRAQLMKLPGLEPKRIDLILAGAVLLEEILFAMKVRKMQVSEYALRDGILLSALQALKANKFQ
jgi:exopolyphosphatase/guanosine-5'-triphosphate,3'-diphosphate pyrophosphatase